VTLMRFDPAMPIELADLRRGDFVAAREAFRVALLIPLCGSAGIWAPSCISSAQVAVSELNEKAGIMGRKVQLIMIDAAEEAGEPVEEVLNDLIEFGSIDAIVGMHLSSIRQRLSKIVRQRVPYVYTPLYEGGEHTQGLFAIGETPDEQLMPAIAQIQKEFRPRSWALIGNDYVWPRSSHFIAKKLLRKAFVRLAMERYVPFGLQDMDVLVSRLEASGADAVLLSLVGQDAIAFNRAFGRAGMHRRVVRLSCAIEENALLASGPENLKRLFSASGYFNVLATEANAAFKERYYSIHGDRAPVLNSIGQSTYEGMHFLAGLMLRHADTWRDHSGRSSLPVLYRSGRKQRFENTPDRAPIYLARADGVQFRIVKEFKNN